MKKLVAVAFISVLLLLAACESKITGKRVAIPDTGMPTGRVVQDLTSAPAANTEPEKTAAEALKELQESPSTSTISGEKSGTFYPTVAVTGTERDALKQKTRALFQQTIYTPNVQDADTEIGSRYHDSDGSSENLPDGYGSDRNGE